ncbi:MAG: ATP-dependent helicase/nuclease subunit [Hyphomicrobiales bacterium]|jgi:ATP-dependent helicase/nuclease subunit A|nr:ATP-dependent helicase/nuclease subunit [Hyphomicrobiales bacterium]
MNIPAGVLDVQRTASDPAVSAWVAANAGSGKTHVLAQRVIRLLLRGTAPEKILCLTYTKAAAANMANRVFETLAKWTPLSDDDLDEEIRKIEGHRPDAKRRTRARRLFAQALDTPGGLKVQTIHAFCTRLLHQFPFEADVAARFEVLEERTRSELIDRLRMGVLLEAAAKPDSDLGRALATAITVAADQTFAEAIDEAIAKHDELEAWIANAGGVAGAIAELSRALGVRPDETTDAIAEEFFSASLIAPSEYPPVIATLEQGLKGDKEHAARFDSLRLLDGVERVRAYQSIFCTAELEPRKNIVSKGIRDRNPSLFQRLLAEQERVCGLIARRRAVETRERTAALVTIAHEVIARYRAEKNRRGLLDYDDLIEKALHLLSAEQSAWVHYKLDLGIDHVLIDEAQDTSPKQWEIVKRLTAEFAAGKGAREVTRSVFAVGDEKQSIFSFQGAEPAEFDRMKRYYGTAFAEAEMAFAEVRFQYSFRSAPTVLDAVDTVFKRPEAHAGLTEVPGATVHEAVRANAPGTVELWPMIEPDEKLDIEGWDAPFDESSETSPRIRLARKIACTVKAWIARRDAVGEGTARRAVRPGDILVLVRQRGALFEAIISELKKESIEVAGADRLTLTEHIAVMDLIALADALLLPGDDLALASVLKSPLFGITEEQLFALAYGRKGTLRAALREKAADLEFMDANARLERYAEWARHHSPFAFYARILGADKGRARLYARLGPEAADALDEFLEHALLYERQEAPTLQGLVAWLRAGDTQVKRDMDIARDEVRVMTVHGAKGLEAPIVILADTTTPPKGPREPRMLNVPVENAAPGTPDRIVWAGRKVDDVAPVAAARAVAVGAAEDEYRRLLYVAMTRAADRLVVAGSRGVNRIPPGCWYELIADALKPEAIEEPADDGDGTVLRWRKSADAGAVEQAARAPARQRHDVPDWLRRNAPAESAVVHAISPSAGVSATAHSIGDSRGLARGRIVHRLLQALPVLAPERRAEAARKPFARIKDFSNAECDAIIGEVLAVLGDARFAPLFAPGSRAEVPIVGYVSHGGHRQTVSGQVDRLAVTGSAVLIADYKSDRAVPRDAGAIPQSYVRQLALYRAVLRLLYPNHEVRAALVWTLRPVLIEVPAAMLDAELSRLGTGKNTEA